ncbi:iron-nutrition responsive ZIP family transporter [Volvox carteri f. nagariensis]|uniref:Iron-nutrition responsive ZIP family transporter n=1 Tax=Volvox carteri f. nagariensis TaxID=3068 RepID=D8TM90_VOLCA|nr:iron-nutrition responsive ZIP family transporter [Volvox carteri f. nagariensis]EFJ51462.1 iron-nutrition responsive ZIP family transporter [Volvox carteri f. nagariensis]|eukprot:XP_002947414.1 iron-nutrition responsive ZIP family transporter [Volvox carteri f. nagariensis]
MAGGCQGISAGRLGVAYACVIGAGVASVAGGLIIIAVPVKNNLFLAASLAFAAGVMLYISVVDIFAGKSVGHFAEAGYDDAYAFTYASICFFCGFPISWALDKLAERLAYQGSEGPSPLAHHPSTSALPEKVQTDDSTSVAGGTLPQQRALTDVESAADLGSQRPSDMDSEQASVKAVRSRKLIHMGILAAMAVALHNMPEGLVTFVGYMDSITSGITTAVAIAIHNIPEGMVISSAVYFGTGRRGRAILWAALAAFTEPLGGLIGLAVVCGGSMTETVFGILFGLVGGIMTYISLKELLPGARSFDPEDRVTTGFLTAGMIIMACSLIAIAFSSP